MYYKMIIYSLSKFLVRILTYRLTNIQRQKYGQTHRRTHRHTPSQLFIHGLIFLVGFSTVLFFQDPLDLKTHKPPDPTRRNCGQTHRISDPIRHSCGQNRRCGPGPRSPGVRGHILLQGKIIYFIHAVIFFKYIPFYSNMIFKKTIFIENSSFFSIFHILLV